MALKRATPLKRRTPLRAYTPGLKRSRLKVSQPNQSRRLRVPSRSAKTAAYEAEFAAIRPFILRRANGVCEACGSTRCGPVAHVHHRLPRSQGGKNDEATLIGVSLACHVAIHAHPADSYRRGLLVHSWADPAEIPILFAD